MATEQFEQLLGQYNEAYEYLARMRALVEKADQGQGLTAEEWNEARELSEKMQNVFSGMDRSINGHEMAEEASEDREQEALDPEHQRGLDEFVERFEFSNSECQRTSIEKAAEYGFEPEAITWTHSAMQMSSLANQADLLCSMAQEQCQDACFETHQDFNQVYNQTAPVYAHETGTELFRDFADLCRDTLERLKAAILDKLGLGQEPTVQEQAQATQASKQVQDAAGQVAEQAQREARSVEREQARENAMPKTQQTPQERFTDLCKEIKREMETIQKGIVEKINQGQEPTAREWAAAGHAAERVRSLALEASEQARTVARTMEVKQTQTQNHTQGQTQEQGQGHGQTPAAVQAQGQQEAQQQAPEQSQSANQGSEPSWWDSGQGQSQEQELSVSR